MPSVKVAAKRFRENNIVCPKTFLRVYGRKLEERGFRIDQPLQMDRSEEWLAVSQEVSGRLANNNPRVWPLLQRIARVDGTAISELLGVLLAEGDDRADVMQTLEAAMPEESFVYADFGTANDGHTTEVISGSKVAERELCGKVLLLMGAREEDL